MSSTRPKSKVRAMEIESNLFCSGGDLLGGGHILNVGGNQTNTATMLHPTASQPRTVVSPTKTMTAETRGTNTHLCANRTCQWSDTSANYMTSWWWHPTPEALAESSMFSGELIDVSLSAPLLLYGTIMVIGTELSLAPMLGSLSDSSPLPDAVPTAARLPPN
ncbi:hypothetical protein DL93DRAFT_1373385 [Clavulina sp. PMI_390]|nr:hypothetical protein DL93DRAFT_1373385 [Clavulina sp. PMI_390]